MLDEKLGQLERDVQADPLDMKIRREYNFQRLRTGQLKQRQKYSKRFFYSFRDDRVLITLKLLDPESQRDILIIPLGLVPPWRKNKSRTIQGIYIFDYDVLFKELEKQHKFYINKELIHQLWIDGVKETEESIKLKLLKKEASLRGPSFFIYSLSYNFRPLGINKFDGKVGDLFDFQHVYNNQKRVVQKDFTDPTQLEFIADKFQSYESIRAASNVNSISKDFPGHFANDSYLKSFPCRLKSQKAAGPVLKKYFDDWYMTLTRAYETTAFPLDYIPGL